MPDLDPNELAALIERAKRQIRRRMRGLRSALPDSAIEQRSRAIVDRVLLLPEFQQATSVALFWPIVENREVDLRALDAEARRVNKSVYYPFMHALGDVVKTGFRLVTDPASLAERGRRFAEPPEDAPEATRGAIDLVLVPALAADGSGFRIGYGAGFYDVTLPDVCPPARSAIVVFDFQLLGELPHTDTDAKCDFIVSDRKVVRPGAPPNSMTNP